MAKIVSKSLSFGLQNYLFIQLDETGLTYYYYGFQDKKGAILIMRTDTSSNNAKYWLGIGAFATVWASKGTYTYNYPVDILEPTVG